MADFRIDSNIKTPPAHVGSGGSAPAMPDTLRWTPIVPETWYFFLFSAGKLHTAMSGYRHRISEEESFRIRRFLRMVAAGTIAFSLLLLAAFLTADRWLLWFSHESERRFVDGYVTLVRKQLLTPSDPVLQDYVEELTLQIANQMQLPEGLMIRVHVVKGPPNAAATLGGHIFVFEGLLHTLDSENSLTMVLAHELAHCINRDPLRSAGRGILLEIASNSAGIRELAGSQLLLRRYSREQERLADRDALVALHARYGHIGGATRLFEILREPDREPMPRSLGERTEFLSTHPALDQRIQTINASAEEKGWPALPTRPYPEEIQAALSGMP